MGGDGSFGHSRPFEFRRESAVDSKAADFAMTLRGDFVAKVRC
jgi:hypothetical protein